MEDWEKLFGPAILKRGFDLCKYNSVSNLTEDGYNNFSADVEGTNGYHVSLTLNSGWVEKPSCTCAYSQSVTYCKHIAAVLYKIRNKYGNDVFLESGYSEKRGSADSSGVEKQKGTILHTLIFEDDTKPHYLSFGPTLNIYKPSSPTLHKATSLIAQGKLENRETKLINDGKEKYLSYSVMVYEEQDHPAIVTIILGRNGITHFSCYDFDHYGFYRSQKHLYRECGNDVRDRNGEIELCVHKTAALLSLFSYLKENRDILDYSDSSAEKLMQIFRKERKTDLIRKYRKNSTIVDIQPTIDGETVFLRISNDGGKYYWVRDVQKLYSAFFNRTDYSLSKTFNIDFDAVSLTPRAEKVMELLKTMTVNSKLSCKERTYFIDRSKIPYTEFMDEFYDTMQSSDILYEGTPLLGFRETEPSFRMKIDAMKDGARTVGVCVSGKISGKYRSRKYIYWYENGYLNRTALSNLGSAAALAEIAGEDGSFSFNVGLNLIDNFYQRILPGLRRCGNIEDNASPSVSSIIEEPPVPVFYGDIDDDEKVIICTPYLRYDGREVRILPDIGKWKNIGLEKKAKWNPIEDDIRTSLDEIFNGPVTEHGDWSVSDDDDSVFEFLDRGIVSLMALGEVNTTDKLRRMILKRMPKVKGTVDIDDKDDSILNFTLDLGGLTVDELAEILKSYRDRKKYYRLKNGDFISLKEENLDTLANLFNDTGLSLKDFIKGRMNIPLYRALYLDQILMEQNGVTYEAGQKFRHLIKDFRTINESDYAVPASLENVMRSYQKDGYRWMRVLFDHGFGGILADDMGLGKTVQALSLLKGFKDEGKNMHTLIISPTSLIYNWKAEARKFTPELNTVTISGAAQERAEIIKENENYDILITSYDLLKRDIALYEGIQFDIEIIDEAQFIKNHNTAQAKAVRAVSSKHRLALTGTPIENRLSELWSIFEYLMPGFLFSEMKFKEFLSNPIEKDGDREAYSRLRKLTGPFILRRLKTDVLKDLPEKIEEIRVSPLEGEQLRLYTAEVAKAQGMLKKDDEYSGKKIEMLAELTRIREICCDPSLVFKDYKGESAKRTAVMELIESAIDSGHRILLFSQFTSMLELLESDLKEKEIEYYKITGDTPKAKRLELVDAFNSGATPLFMISLKAGGTGLNLTGADIVIHYDPWWNTAAQDQATDRAHRIGQTKRVTVYRMIAQDTIEEKIVKLQETKKNLADGIVSGDNVSLSSLSKEDLLELLSISDIDK